MGLTQCARFANRNPERWQSGRMYLTRNQAWVQIHRGFESHPLRQNLSFEPASPRARLRLVASSWLCVKVDAQRCSDFEDRRKAWVAIA